MGDTNFLLLADHFSKSADLWILGDEIRQLAVDSFFILELANSLKKSQFGSKRARLVTLSQQQKLTDQE